MSLRESIEWTIDKGLSRAQLVREVSDSHPGRSLADVDEEVARLLGLGHLTQGKMYGHEDWLVVTEWMPNMAAKLKSGA